MGRGKKEEEDCTWGRGQREQEAGARASKRFGIVRGISASFLGNFAPLASPRRLARGLAYGQPSTMPKPRRTGERVRVRYARLGQFPRELGVGQL